jgi:hypothetical protein
VLDSGVKGGGSLRRLDLHAKRVLLSQSVG